MARPGRRLTLTVVLVDGCSAMAEMATTAPRPVLPVVTAERRGFSVTVVPVVPVVPGRLVGSVVPGDR